MGFRDESHSATRRDTLEYVLVAAAPNPVRNAELMATLRKHLRRPGLPSPETVLRLGAVLIRTDPALGLTGRYATSKVLDANLDEASSQRTSCSRKR